MVHDAVSVAKNKNNTYYIILYVLHEKIYNVIKDINTFIYYITISNFVTGM